MILRKEIYPKLERVNALYLGSSTSISDQIFYSKGSLIELCGWIEDSLDLIAMRAVKGLIVTASYTQIATSIVGNVYGFDYKKYFRPLMISMIGVFDMENIENKLGAEISQLTAILDRLKKYRGAAAHSLKTPSLGPYSSPSIIIQDFKVIYPILVKLYSTVIKYNKCRIHMRKQLLSQLSD
jgi:hypothetical protein